MSEQQQLHHVSLLNAQQNSRPHGPHMLPVSYLPGPRIDGIPSNQYFYLRPGEQPLQPYVFRPPFLYPCQPPVSDVPYSNANQEDYGSLAINPQTYQHQISYPHLIPNSHPLPATVPSAQRPTVSPHTSPVKSRPKRLLEIQDPQTHATIDLQSISSKLNTHPPVPVKTEAGDTLVSADSTTNVTATQDVITTTSETISKSDQSNSLVLDSITPEPEVNVQQVKTLVEEEDSSTSVIENGLLVVENKDTDADDATETDSYVDSEDVDTDTSYRRMYSREALLSLKDSPVARVAPQKLVMLADYYNIRKVHRGAHRTQRIIHLPTGITIKRIEDAFVPSQIRRNQGDNVNTKKTLSQDLSVILNRLSPNNVSQTVDDIKKLKISSVEDLQILADSIFQKAIRQTKYSKVFARLCKELKGFSVKNSDTLEILVLRRMQDLFDTPLENLVAESNADIDQKILEAKDDDLKKLLEDDRETIIAKKTDTYYGNITLLADLYLNRLVTQKTMVECLKKLRESQAPEAVTSLLILLRSCGSELDNLSRNYVDACFNRLDGLLKSNKLLAHQAFKVQDLFELRSRCWKEENVSHSPATREVVSKRADDKNKRSSIASFDTKRKSVQSTNPVTPFNLAFTQEPCDSKKLKPTVDNWTQGSGQLSKNVADNCAAQSSLKKTSQQTLLSNSSREASPLMGSNVRNSRESRPSVHSSIIAASVTPDSKTTDDRQASLKRTSGSARSFVSLLSSTEEDPSTMITECKPKDRSALLQNAFELLMDKSFKDRDTAGDVCLRLLNSGVLKPQDIRSACQYYFSSCDDDWLEDYPFGWKYLSEILQHLIQKEQDHFPLLCEILRPLVTSGQSGAIVLAHCLSKSAERLTSECVSAKFQSLHLDWSKFGVPTETIVSFAQKYSVSFTLCKNDLHTNLQTLAKLADTCASSEEVINFFRRLSISELPTNFVQSCTSTMVSKFKGVSRQSIDELVMGLSIVVDHDAERESQVLQGLEDCSKSGVSTDQWLESLLEKKVISKEAFNLWNASHTGDDQSIIHNLPLSTS